MYDIGDVLGKIKNPKKRTRGGMNSLFGTKSQSSPRSNLKSLFGEETVPVNNFIPVRQNKKILTTLESYDEDNNILSPVNLTPVKKMVLDSDGDGIPDAIDPNPYKYDHVVKPMTRQKKNNRAKKIWASVLGED